jgi:MFS family permease
MFGKKRLLVVVLGILSVGTLVSALATDLPIMLVGRVIQGAGGAVFPLSFGIIRDEFPQPRVVGAIGFLSSVLGVGAGLGIVLAGPIIGHLDYHWLFWIPLVMVLISAVATVVFIPESPVRAPGRINVTGAVLMSLSEGPVLGWGDPRLLALYGATVVFAVWWVRAESRSAHPLIDMRMMRIPEVWTTNLAALLFGFGMYVMFTIVPQFVETSSRHGFGFSASVTQSGLDLLPFALAMLLVAPLTGRLSVAFGSRRVLLAACCFSAAAYLFLVPWHAHSWQVLISAGLLGVGVAMGFSSMTNLVVEAVPQTQTAVATGMNTNIRNVGAALGAGIATSIVVGDLLARGVPAEHGYVVAFAVSAGALVIAAVATLAIPRHVGRDGESVVAATVATASATVPVVGAD